MATRSVGLCLSIVLVSGMFADGVAAQDQLPAQGPVSRAILPAAAGSEPGDFPVLGVPYVFGQQPIQRKKKEEPPKKEELQLTPEELESLRPQQTAFAPIDNKPMLPDTNYFGLRTFSVVSALSVNVDGRLINATVVDQFSVLAPILTRGSFKVADNASPRPLDRVFFYYNYYNNVPVQVRGAASTLTLDPGNRIFQGLPPGPYTLRQTLVRTLINDPKSAPQSLTNTSFTFANVHQETIGFEKTFLEGAASVEMRLPFLQVRQGIASTFDQQKLDSFGFRNADTNAAVIDPANSLGDSFVGDLTLVGKYAIVDNRENGNLISIGLALTVPTGQAVTVGGPAQFLAPPALSFSAPVGPLVPVFPANQNFRDVLFQPFVGYIYNIDRFYIHGFESVVVPTDSRDATILFSDLGVGRNLFQRTEGLIRGITPTVEGHLTNGLNHNNADGGATISDVFAINAGVHIQLGARSILSFGVSTPLTGPRPYRVEGMVLFNYVF